VSFIVTARDEGYNRNRDIYETAGTLIPHKDIYFTGMGAKQVVMVDKYGLSPDIWIDDAPVGIVG